MMSRPVRIIHEGFAANRSRLGTTGLYRAGVPDTGSSTI
jgi:hypothetical protein